MDVPTHICGSGSLLLKSAKRVGRQLVEAYADRSTPKSYYRTVSVSEVLWDKGFQTAFARPGAHLMVHSQELAELFAALPSRSERASAAIWWIELGGDVKSVLAYSCLGAELRGNYNSELAFAKALGAASDADMSASIRIVRYGYEDEIISLDEAVGRRFIANGRRDVWANDGALALSVNRDRVLWFVDAVENATDCELRRLVIQVARSSFDCMLERNILQPHGKTAIDWNAVEERVAEMSRSELCDCTRCCYRPLESLLFRLAV